MGDLPIDRLTPDLPLHIRLIQTLVFMRSGVSLLEEDQCLSCDQIMEQTLFQLKRN